jgi:hypothetical protein
VEPCRADDLATIQAGPVRPLIEHTNGLVDSLQHFRLHLNERKRQIFLGLGVERFAQLRGVVARAGSFFAKIADPALNLIQQFTLTRHEHAPYIGAAVAD